MPTPLAMGSLQVLPELDAVAVQVSERVRSYFGEAESYDDFQPGTDVSQIFDVREYRRLYLFRTSFHF